MGKFAFDSFDFAFLRRGVLVGGGGIWRFALMVLIIWAALSFLQIYAFFHLSESTLRSALRFVLSWRLVCIIAISIRLNSLFVGDCCIRDYRICRGGVAPVARFLLVVTFFVLLAGWVLKWIFHPVFIGLVYKTTSHESVYDYLWISRTAYAYFSGIVPRPSILGICLAGLLELFVQLLVELRWLAIALFSYAFTVRFPAFQVAFVAPSAVLCFDLVSDQVSPAIRGFLWGPLHLSTIDAKAATFDIALIVVYIPICLIGAFAYTYLQRTIAARFE